MAESTIVTFNYECPYRNICSDNGKNCESCRHNPKRSYYEPVEPYIPYITYIPYPYIYPNWYPTTIDTTSLTATDKTHCQAI